jgi:hypothetical protein
MSYRDSEVVAFILEAAIDGITKSYLAGKRENYAVIKEHVELLVQEQFLAELADKSRNYIAYRTTQKGLQHLLAHSSLHRISMVTVEA